MTTIYECPQCHSTDLKPVVEQLQCQRCRTMAYPHHCMVVGGTLEGDIGLQIINLARAANGLPPRER